MNRLRDTDVYKIIDIKEININIWRLMEQIRYFLEGGILEEVFLFSVFFVNTNFTNCLSRWKYFGRTDRHRLKARPSSLLKHRRHSNRVGRAPSAHTNLASLEFA